MSDDPTPAATTRSFEEKYQVCRAGVVRDTVRSALGSDLPNGYTTLDQAERLAGHLNVGLGDLLLDLGAGRGWPGSHIAEATGCGLISSDLPMEALVVAQQSLAAMGPDRLAEALCADGRRLPFGDAVFDAVCHADVLC